MPDEMYIAKSQDDEMFKKAENGGVVTSLLKYILEDSIADTILTIKAKNGDRYAGTPVLIDDPDKLLETAGSLHCSTPNIARFLREYIDEIPYENIAVVCKPCDARAIIELSKREQINLDDLVLIGVNCTGTISPVTAKKMMKEEFKIDPNHVVKEDIEEGTLTVFLNDGSKVEKNLFRLEEKGYGRRENCKVCNINIPRMVDIACGKWGTDNENETFVEICSDKGYNIFKGAIEKDVIDVREPSEENISERDRKDKNEIEKAEEQRKIYYKSIMDLEEKERLNYWMGEFNKCIKCYGCRDACPLCYCEECILEPDRGFIKSGEIPPNNLFPLTRLSHVADSCVNCGQCQEACPMDIPLSKLYSVLNDKLMDIFDYIPGIDEDDEPPLLAVDDRETKIDETFLDTSLLSRD